MQATAWNPEVTQPGYISSGSCCSWNPSILCILYLIYSVESNPLICTCYFFKQDNCHLLLIYQKVRPHKHYQMFVRYFLQLPSHLKFVRNIFTMMKSAVLQNYPVRIYNYTLFTISIYISLVSEDLKQDSNSSDSLKENAKRISQD